MSLHTTPRHGHTTPRHGHTTPRHGPGPCPDCRPPPGDLPPFTFPPTHAPRHPLPHPPSCVPSMGQIGVSQRGLPLPASLPWASLHTRRAVVESNAGGVGRGIVRVRPKTRRAPARVVARATGGRPRAGSPGPARAPFTCALCTERPSAIMFLPCMCVATCAECALVLADSTRACCACQAPIDSTLPCVTTAPEVAAQTTSAQANRAPSTHNRRSTSPSFLQLLSRTLTAMQVGFHWGGGGRVDFG